LNFRVAEPQHFYAAHAPFPGKKINAAPAMALASKLSAKILKITQ
jgi:hypothetical protein